MKKSIICCLLFAVCLSIATASSWTVKHYVDEFGDETEDIYLTTVEYGTGTYTDYTVTDSPLKWGISIEEDFVWFKLFENGTDLVKGNYQEKEYSVILRDDKGDDYDFTAYLYSEGLYLAFSDTDSFIRLLSVNSSPRMVIKENTDSSFAFGSTYKSGVIDTSGFSALYKETYGVDWSAPLTIELSTESLEVIIGDDSIASFGVDVYLDSQKIDCEYQVTFDYALQRSINGDSGFSESWCHTNRNSDTWRYDRSRIYLNHFLANLTEERTGYVTVQIGDISRQCLVTVINPPAPEFSLNEFYRSGDMLIKATLKNCNAELVFTIDESDIRTLLSWVVAEVDPVSFADITYSLEGSFLNLTYPARTETEVEELWQLFESALNLYNGVEAAETSEEIGDEPNKQSGDAENEKKSIIELFNNKKTTDNSTFSRFEIAPYISYRVFSIANLSSPGGCELGLFSALYFTEKFGIGIELPLLIEDLGDLYPYYTASFYLLTRFATPEKEGFIMELGLGFTGVHHKEDTITVKGVTKIWHPESKHYGATVFFNCGGVISGNLYCSAMVEFSLLFAEDGNAGSAYDFGMILGWTF